MFAKCADDPQVLELLQKCFVRIKKQNKLQQLVMKTEKKKLKKKKNSNNNHKKEKIN